MLSVGSKCRHLVRSRLMDTGVALIAAVILGANILCLKMLSGEALRLEISVSASPAAKRGLAENSGRPIL